MYRYLALGDSYTVGESVPPADCYPAQTVSLLNQEGFLFAAHEIVAVTGWTSSDLIWALEKRGVPVQTFDVVSLLIGVNDQYQGRSLAEYGEQFTRLIEMACDLAGGQASHVVVLSIPDYSFTPFGRAAIDFWQISSQIDSFNEVNRIISARYRVRYLDITAESRKIGMDEDLVAKDGLHYAAKEYAAWARGLAGEIKQIIDKG